MIWTGHSANLIYEEMNGKKCFELSGKKRGQFMHEVLTPINYKLLVHFCAIYFTIVKANMYAGCDEKLFSVISFGFHSFESAEYL